ncbi:hypothetical protein Vqi01_43950 [Micromonospora qiuiae]|uniref:OmpR/PhoB-type domain-containing protein n=1 Tax=Micromonospora qiuiae TaxID=502268 RepID=A0ABQ4JFR5_9ACTN|nr:BTAD domain-containing putative transcriptional regulator [Micromonospora qiuiae]GIJ29233.1 hypothetical protein Vqi01_43950 [Micromonospora qiuiae]
MHLRFSLLGLVRAWAGGREIDLGPPLQRALLAVLLFQLNRPVSNEHVVRALWGNAAPRSAYGAVRTYIYRLRRKMTEVVDSQHFALHSHCGGYLLTADGATIDTEVFQHRLASARQAKEQGDLGRSIAQFRAALALWQGVPIAGMDTAFFNTERERLERLRGAAVEELTTAEIRIGDHASALTTVQEALASQPLRERLWELLMEALFGLGRRADALAAYQDARRVLQAELGLEPSTRLRELHCRILTPEPAGYEPAVEPIIPLATTAALDILTPTADGFVGRTTELSELISRVVGSPQPVLVGLTGAPRVGKSALAIRAAHFLQPHFPDGHFFARPDGHDGEPRPDGVLVRFLRQCDVPLAQIPCTLPELTALWRATVNGKRVVVILDDVQEASWVLPLLPNSAGSAVLITCRQPLTGLPALHTITLGGLSLPDALQLLGSSIGPNRLHEDVEAAARLVAACGYQPHLVRAAARRLLEVPSRSMTDVERELAAHAKL